MNVPVPQYQAHHPAHAYLPSISHKHFLTRQIFTKSSPSSQLLLQNLTKQLYKLICDILFLKRKRVTSEMYEKLLTREGCVNTCRSKKFNKLWWFDSEAFGILGNWSLRRGACRAVILLVCMHVCARGRS